MLIINNFSPVCGSNGQTYSNMCNLEAASCVSNTIITVSHQGPCDQRQCSRTEFQCPSDGSCISYLNVCDKVLHCDDGADEQQNCEADCAATDFRCGDGQCIPFRTVIQMLICHAISITQ